MRIKVILHFLESIILNKRHVDLFYDLLDLLYIIYLIEAKQNDSSINSHHIKNNMWLLATQKFCICKKIDVFLFSSSFYL